MGKRIHRFASHRNLRGVAFAEVCELKGIVNVLQVHSAVKGQVEQDPLVRAAFEKMVSTGTSAHHAEHILGALLFETEWETARAVEAGKDIEKIQKMYIHRLQKLSRDSAFRKKLTRRFTADHAAFE